MMGGGNASDVLRGLGSGWVDDEHDDIRGDAVWAQHNVGVGIVDMGGSVFWYCVRSVDALCRVLFGW